MLARMRVADVMTVGRDGAPRAAADAKASLRMAMPQIDATGRFQICYAVRAYPDEVGFGIRSSCSFEHVLFAKPVSTFAGHA